MGAGTMEWLAGLVADCYRGTPPYSVWEWAERNVFLDAKAAAVPQFYDSSLTPWTRRYQECLLDQDVDEIVVMKSSQSGFTEGSLNILRFMPQHCPGNALYAINSRDEARDISRRRLKDTLLAAAGDLVPQADEDLTTHRIVLRNMQVTVTGSGAAGPFMQTWYRVAILDELEEHDQTDDTTTIDRARSRFTTVQDSKLFALSKPKRVGGIIHAEYLTGTCEKYHVACPLCGHRQELVWDRLRFSHCRDLAGEYDSERIEKEVFYECAGCSGRIEESAKRAMVENGIWVPTPAEEREKPLMPRKVSMQISDLYSLFPKVRWPQLVRLWLESKDDLIKRRHFWTNHLGLAWEQRAATVRDADIMELRAGTIDPETGEARGERYDWTFRDGQLVGELPFRPALLSISVDKQQDRLKYLVCAWRATGECHLVEYGQLLDEAELLEMRLRDYPVAGTGELVRIDTGVMDAGYRPSEVYQACLDSDFWLYPTRGIPNTYGRKMISATKEYFKGRVFLRYDYNDHALKSEFYLGKIQKRTAPRLYFPWDIPPEFTAEFAAEKLTKTQNKAGYERMEWVKKSGQANDYGDCGKLQYLIWHVLGADVMAQHGVRPMGAALTPAGGNDGDGE